MNNRSYKYKFSDTSDISSTSDMSELSDLDEDISSISSFSITSESSMSRSPNNISKESKHDINHFINSEFVSMCKKYDYIPAINEKVRRIVVLGDIHGDYKLALKLLTIGKVIDSNTKDGIKWIGGDTVIVQVGDQIDRCRPESIDSLTCAYDGATINDEASDMKILRLFTNLHYKAKEQGGKVISLLGNHELMNVEGYMNYVSKKNIDEFNKYVDPKNRSLTFKSGEDARKYAFKPGNEISKYLGCTRLSCVVIGSNLFVHAGMINVIMDELKINKKEDLESIDILVRKWLLGLINKEYVKHIVNGADKSMFWTRILGNIPHNISNEDPRCLKHIDKVLETFQIGSIIIGHTPQSFMHGEGINGICNNKIWRVDNGSSEAFHGYDKKFLATGIVDENRTPQVLEILNDTEYRILK